MGMQDFVTAVKYKLPMTIVIMNNEKIGMIEFEQQAIGNTNYEVDIADINFAEFANACGGKGYRVTEFEQLQQALSDAKTQSVPTIIDVKVKDEPPLPGKISYTQAAHFSEYMIKELFSEKKLDIPPIKKSIKRLF